ncbi:tryptophan-tRNA ligase [Exophiala sideris]|uniref:tryptophan--tRNA ligase n=1 Tax=Exophiala sideris TaxID=1016849 RepID=A0A0D1W9Q8_9EURO|nr:tryptophan-tRNA ligase [Exophiala sideris]
MLPGIRRGALRSSTLRTSQCRCYSNNSLRPDQQPIEGTGGKDVQQAGQTTAEPFRPFHEKTIVFSGIQPTGVPHLGNYLGALRQWKLLHDNSAHPSLKGKKKPMQYFSVVDLHALTSEAPGPDRLRLRKESYAALLAIGLKNTRQTTLFFQSDVRYHTELMWILSTIASTGYLSRMTQWKSKLNLPDDANLDSDEATAKLKLGLFSYPVLQAADILLYEASLVPVGEDQLQHIEFARTLARGFNSHVRNSPDGSNVFRIPSAALSPAKRIMSLKRPTQKMSKSDPDPRSRILITDSHEDIHAKIRAAVTDSEPGISYDPEKRPGVSNLVEILRHVTTIAETPDTIAKDLQYMTMRGLKEMVADNIAECLSGIRENFLELMEPGNRTFYDEVSIGAGKAEQKARVTMRRVRESLGLNTFGTRLDTPKIDETENVDADGDANVNTNDYNISPIFPESNTDSPQTTEKAILEALQGIGQSYGGSYRVSAGGKDPSRKS